MGALYCFEDLREKLIKNYTELSENDDPFYVHCIAYFNRSHQSCPLHCLFELSENDDPF